MEIELNKSFKERIFHAVIFEVTANVIIALSLAWLMNVSVLQSGSLSVISALTATVWNFFFNKLFDALQKKHQFQRTFLVRAIHAVGFETGLIISLIPVAMFMLNLTIAEALKIFEAYMSPGSVTEKLYFYLAEYQPKDKTSAGGGIKAEGEDIDVLEMPFEEALRGIDTGKIVDGKTIMLLYHIALKGIL